MERSFSMNAVLIGSNTVSVPNAGKHAVTAVGETERVSRKAVSAYIQMSRARVKAFLTRLIGGIGRTLERRRQADIQRLNRPLSLDEAWAGGWYGRSRLLQEGLLHGSLNSAQTRKPEPKNWDDRLD
jgi:hypothetical protein